MTVRQRVASLRGDRGDTLVEILVTIIVLGITVTAVVGALTLTITSSETHRRLSNAEIVTRAYGEKVVDQALHAPATTLTADANAGDTSVSVDPGTTFPATPFTAAVDGEVVQVTKISADKKTWTVSALAEAHSNGSAVQQYYFYDAANNACPSASSFNVTGYTAPTGSKINTPTITTIEYFDNDGNQISAAECNGTASSPTTPYWEDKTPPSPLAATICSGFATPEHLTECDEGLIRLTISASSTDTGATSASTTTSVLINRGNA